MLFIGRFMYCCAVMKWCENMVFFLSKKEKKFFGELKFMLCFWYIKQESYLASEKKLEGSFFLNFNGIKNWNFLMLTVVVTTLKLLFEKLNCELYSRTYFTYYSKIINLNSTFGVNNFNVRKITSIFKILFTNT